ncbi:hypothetical protein Tco_0397300 [Tanacetum coccineum]
MDREVKQLKQSRIPIVKVRWNSKRGPEYTWEREDQMWKKFLKITPIDQAHLFVSPPSGDAIMDFVNELGYPKAQLSSSSDALGIITSTNVDYAELMWEEFVQGMQTFLTDKANFGSPIKKGRKDKPHVILYCRFTKLIICHLGRIHNIHQRSASLFHLAEEDPRLGNLKFVFKGKIDEVFGMAIPNEKVATEKEGKKKSASTKQPKPKPVIEKSSKPAHAPKLKVTKEKPSKASTAKPPNPKPTKEKSTKATPLQKASKGKVAKVCNVKSSFQLVNEPDEEPSHSKPEPEPEQEGAGEEYDMERAIQMSLESRIPTTKEASTRPSAQPLDDTSANITRDSPSPIDAETGARSDKTSSGDRDGSDPGETLESRPQPEQLMHDEFLADLYPKVQESLKFSADEHVILEDPLSSTRTLSSMKNLEDAYAIRDQFINDKSIDDEPGKLNMEAEVVSMVTVPIYQASSFVLPLSTPVINLKPPKPASSTTQTSIFTATTTTTTTTLPRPLQQQSITESELAERVAALEKKLFDLEQTNKNLDNITQNLRSRVYTLELRAPLRDHFRDLSKEDMKEILHQRMFETSSYKSLLEHIALYEALKASMERTQRDGFLAEKDKSYVYELLLPKDGKDRVYSKGKAYEVVKPSYPDVIHPQFHMEECHTMLTEHIDWANPEGDQVRIDISKPLPLSGPSGHKQLNLTKPGRDATCFEFKHDYTIIDSPPTVVFPVSNNERKIIRLNEIYKFHDGTLTNIIEALDYRVKEYKVNRLNPGMNTWFWTDKDMLRSKEFINAIERRLKTRRIFWNLECFIGGRVRDIDYRLLQRME